MALSKNMLKPTGFEREETPLNPSEYEKALEKYHPEDTIISRLETAVNSFNSNRKMHQDTRAIFEKLVSFGGFRAKGQFQGGMNKKQMKREGMSKEEIELASAHYCLLEDVTNSYWKEAEEGQKPSWIVDFEALAKAFLSSQFLHHFQWYDPKQLATATMVLRNFYNYLIVHPVCPEYKQQILAASAICDVAEQELPKLAVVGHSLPGAFNSACSTVFGGAYADVHLDKAARNSWAQGADNVGLSRHEATIIFKAGVAAHSTPEQYAKIAALHSDLGDAKCISTENMGLEITAVELPDADVEETYEFLRKREGFHEYVHTMGKLICKRWKVPFEQPVDLPDHLMKAKADMNQRFEFLVEAETLAYCVPGMKMVTVVKELDVGIKWIDCVESMHPTFYTWLLNEQNWDWKEPGPPTEWMQRAMAKRMGLAEVEIELPVFHRMSLPRLLSPTIRRATTLTAHLHPRTLHPVRTMASLPTKMKGVIIEKTGGTEVLQYKTDLPVPSPGDGQVLVKNDYVGVNFIDTYFRTGLYPAPKYPYILGREAEGTVVKAGSGELYGLKEGDKVLMLSEGTYAEYTAANAVKAVKVKDGLEAKVGAAALLQGLTALTLIREAHPVKKGDWVLVHAAAGGTGLWLVQLLKAVGANIIGTASTQEKVDLARKAGAEHMINYSHEDVKSKVMELTKDAGCIAVFDGVGKTTFDLSLDCLARKGSMVSFGNASGAVPPVTIGRLSAKNARLMRPTLFNYIATREEFEHYVDELMDFITEDKLDARIHETYALSDVARAHNDLEGRKTTGKLLLDPSK
ncbi:NADPH:quinone reductase [Friedmanniomyces endolithicus]|uniref:Probable quinone oxidoreductase n=2 Tax=Friedmanniomyces endolithicus TaxID=329885 RepID=A0AAN6KRM6_9PEZI|nr:NADPH:quinone reductase [Friedmanniomyces endolithicus]KAK0272554.1 NADPH:quinone reductase [Friedmanniomyces endolithicus]KAK0308578.1 NADPH:quinone reductase [Friedmanniomyces endolithicus]KAK0924440.1 NADPH:quinone reductase [Friedmanniomyces endolithicus]KAK0988968.1 NADPH:quinone reductase [Friedmanniomyces endolithicus]